MFFVLFFWVRVIGIFSFVNEAAVVSWCSYIFVLVPNYFAIVRIMGASASTQSSQVEVEAFRQLKAEYEVAHCDSTMHEGVECSNVLGVCAMAE